ncbi:hypothetical protein Tco_0860554 [Tanacetum coccineum]|uniref:Uncharacterized protein n=1 Tax=Tanacetum coccineum TaxID=301880 RepID=A0ABQ5BID3_9ASTR
MSPNNSAITLRCVSVNVESLSLEPPVRNTIHSSNVILAFLFNPHLIGYHLLFEIDNAGRSDDGIDQAGSGVADDCTCSSGVVSSSICSSSGIDETEGLSLVSVVIQAVYLAEAAVFEERRAAVLMNLLVVEEEVVDEVETQVVFSVKHVSFSSFFVLQPNQLGAGQYDHGPLTSPELSPTFCDLHELGRNWIPTCGGEESLSCRLLASL